MYFTTLSRLDGLTDKQQKPVCQEKFLEPWDLIQMVETLFSSLIQACWVIEGEDCDRMCMWSFHPPTRTDGHSLSLEMDDRQSNTCFRKLAFCR